MAEFLQTFGAVDLALGKPGIHSLPVSSTVGDALRMLRETGLPEISVWDCGSSGAAAAAISTREVSVSVNCSTRRKWECCECRCLGKVNLLDIVCYYASGDKVFDIEAASKDPVSVLLSPAKRNEVCHLDLRSSLVLDGAQCFVVPLDARSLKLTTSNSKSTATTTIEQKYEKMDFCWLTQEDVLRFMLGCIGLFSPAPAMSIQELGIIDKDVMFVDANSEASEALPLMIQASQKMSAVAIVEEREDGRLKLVGDVSIASLANCCDETVAMALASLSISDFMTFIQQDAAGAPDSLKELILAGLALKHKKQDLSYERIKLGMAAEATSNSSSSSDTDMINSSSSGSSSDSSSLSSSSDDDTASSGSVARRRSSRRSRAAARFQAPCSSSAPLYCNPGSSLVAVIAQALAFRRTYLWVTDDEHGLVGMVTYRDMIRVLLKEI